MIAGALVAAGWGTYMFHSNTSVDSARLLIATGNDQSIDPNEFATGLVMPVSIVLILFLSARRLYVKVIWLSALVVLLTGLAVSGSRGATIGIVAVGLYTFWRSRYRRQLVAIMCAAVLAIVASPVGERFTQGDLASGDGRVDIWKVGIASLHQYWLAGAGIGNFNLAFEQYFLAIYHQPLAWDRAAHSIFIQSAVEYGIAGFVLTMAIWFFAIRELQYVRGDDRVNDMCIALSAGVLGLFVSGFSLDLMIYKYTWLAFALIALMRSMLLTTGVPISKPGAQRSSAVVELQHVGGPAG
jgi:O-Antigen ligase